MTRDEAVEIRVPREDAEHFLSVLNSALRHGTSAERYDRLTAAVHAGIYRYEHGAPSLPAGDEGREALVEVVGAARVIDELLDRDCEGADWTLDGTPLDSSASTDALLELRHRLADIDRAAAASSPPAGGEKERCPRDSDWCDGVLCRERGIDCPNADPAPAGGEGQDAPAREDAPAKSPHGMVPGSHERAGGPECRCGAAWSRWDGCCVTGQRVDAPAREEAATEDEIRESARRAMAQRIRAHQDTRGGQDG